MDEDDRPLGSLFQILQIPFEIQGNGGFIVIPVRNGFDPDVGDDGVVVGPGRVGDVDFLGRGREFVEFGKEESGEMVRSGSRESLDAVVVQRRSAKAAIFSSPCTQLPLLLILGNAPDHPTLIDRLAFLAKDQTPSSGRKPRKPSDREVLVVDVCLFF